MSSEIREKSSFEDLSVWQKSIDFSVRVYDVTKTFPSDERFGLTSQLRRASVSIASNISEGSTRGVKEFIHFLNITRGSMAEVKTQLTIAQRVGYIEDGILKELMADLNEISRMSAGLKKSLLSKNTYNLELATQN